MNRKELEKAIAGEVERWPGVAVEFVEPAGKGHPKAKFTFDGKILARPYPGTPSDSAFGIHNCLGDMRRVMKQLGAVRDKPEPTKEEDEAPYRKPNKGREARPDPAHEKAKPKPDVADQLVAAGAATEEQAEIARASIGKDGPLKDGQGRAILADPGSPNPSLFERMSNVLDDRRGDDEREGGSPEELQKAFKARVAAIRDGIYFDLPEDVYHAVPRLSSSGIQKICVSPATFWRNSWLDPEKEDDSDDEKLFRRLGKAYHMARLQPELFDSCFVRELSKDDYPKDRLLVTGGDMKAELEDMGLKTTGTVAEQAERLAEGGCRKFIWRIEEARWEAEKNGRTPIPAKHFDQMKTDIDRIHKQGPIAKLLQGGEAEVSIFWTDDYGIQMKARIDYLAVARITDFKTFDNSRGKELHKTLADAVQYNRYYIQPAVYREAYDAIRGGLEIVEATEAQRDFIAKIRLSTAEFEFWFAFQEKNGVPNLLGKEFPFTTVPYSTLFHDALSDDERNAAIHAQTRQTSRIYSLARRDVLASKKKFALYSQVYAPGEPWFPFDPLSAFTDDDWNPYWLEGALL